MYAPRYALGQYDTYTIDVGSSKSSSSCTSASSAHSQSAAQSQSSRHSTSPSSHSQHWHSSTQSSSCATAVFAKPTTPSNTTTTNKKVFIFPSLFSLVFERIHHAALVHTIQAVKISRAIRCANSHGRMIEFRRATFRVLSFRGLTFTVLVPVGWLAAAGFISTAVKIPRASAHHKQTW